MTEICHMQAGRQADRQAVNPSMVQGLDNRLPRAQNIYLGVLVLDQYVVVCTIERYRKHLNQQFLYGHIRWLVLELETT